MIAKFPSLLGIAGVTLATWSSSFITPAMPNKEGNFAIITVVPETGPNDVATKDLVKEVRSLSDKNGVDLLVTGSTAVNEYDCQQYKRKTYNEHSKHRYRIIQAI